MQHRHHQYKNYKRSNHEGHHTRQGAYTTRQRSKRVKPWNPRRKRKPLRHCRHPTYQKIHLTNTSRYKIFHTNFHQIRRPHHRPLLQRNKHRTQGQTQQANLSRGQRNVKRHCNPTKVLLQRQHRGRVRCTHRQSCSLKRRNLQHPLCRRTQFQARKKIPRHRHHCKETFLSHSKFRKQQVHLHVQLKTLHETNTPFTSTTHLITSTSRVPQQPSTTRHPNSTLSQQPTHTQKIQQAKVLTTQRQKHHNTTSRPQHNKYTSQPTTHRANHKPRAHTCQENITQTSHTQSHQCKTSQIFRQATTWTNSRTTHLSSYT